MDSYVTGIVMDYQMDRFLLIDKGGIITPHGPKLKWQGIGGKIEPYPDGITDRMGQERFETPHEAMFREFKEETGCEIKKSRWHCFFIKEYKNACKIYNFIVFASPDEMINIVQSKHKPEGKVEFHTLVDCYCDPQLYTFDLPYRIQMIIREVKMGMFTKLDPEGINSSGKVLK